MGAKERRVCWGYEELIFVFSAVLSRWWRMLAICGFNWYEEKLLGSGQTVIGQQLPCRAIGHIELLW